MCSTLPLVFPSGKILIKKKKKIPAHRLKPPWNFTHLPSPLLELIAAFIGKINITATCWAGRLQIQGKCCGSKRRGGGGRSLTLHFWKSPQGRLGSWEQRVALGVTCGVFPKPPAKRNRVFFLSVPASPQSCLSSSKPIYCLFPHWEAPQIQFLFSCFLFPDLRVNS